MRKGFKLVAYPGDSFDGIPRVCPQPTTAHIQPEQELAEIPKPPSLNQRKIQAIENALLASLTPTLLSPNSVS